MAASFAAYASQFLNRQQQPSSMSSSQPLFFSFTTDNESRNGNAHDLDLDDLDDPHLRTSAASKRGAHVEEDDDPYLRLDEEDSLSRNNPNSMRLLDSHRESEQESSKGWLAHQASPLRNYRSSSPSSSSRSESSNESGIPPPDIFPRHPPPRPRYVQRTSPPPPPPPPTSLSLTESLLPRDGTIRPMDVFSLSDPRHLSRKRRKYNDSLWTTVWCTGVTSCLISSILILFLTRMPPNPRVNFPYTTFLHTVPMLTILIFLSAAVSYAHIFLLRIFVKPVMIATSVFIPATLFVSAVWAFVGSFMWDVDTEPTWGETIGLRIFSLVPLVLSLLSARRLLDLPRDIHTASSLLTLTTQLLQNNPFLLGLSPTVLLGSLVASIPFLTLTFRLLLIGYTTSPLGSSSSLEWHVRGWADWAICATIVVWLWSWGVVRGILRVTCAGVVGCWYFADPSSPHAPPTSTHTIHAALTRATSPSLGSIVLSALIVTFIQFLGLLTTLFRLLPSYLPFVMRPYLQPLVIASGFAVGYLENATNSLSTYALIYTGLTGDAFFPSARRSKVLTSAVDSSVARYRRRFKTEPPLAMLTYAPLTLTFPFALTTYLFVAHTLGVPDHALPASLLAGGITALVGLYCVGLVKDIADTLYICYCIDQDAGQKRRKEVFHAFEYETRKPQAVVAQPHRSTPQQSQPPPLIQITSPQPASNTPVRQHRLQSPIAVDRVRLPTPDPFERSPVDEDLQPHASTRLKHGYPIDDEITPGKLEEVLDTKASMRTDVSHNTDGGDETMAESQLFPGSDIF